MKRETANLLRFEKEAWDSGLKSVAGVDEVGRGPLAGPVIAAAVVFRAGEVPEGIRDSKQLSPAKRERLFVSICEQAVSIGLGIVSEKVIDRINILRATHLAMRKALASLSVKPGICLVDGMRIPRVDGLQKAVVNGDKLSASIGAASIIAKVTRDRIMIDQDRRYPEYGFASHKGYGTKVHIAALERFGPCKIHRFTFNPVRKVVERRKHGESTS